MIKIIREFVLSYLENNEKITVAEIYDLLQNKIQLKSKVHLYTIIKEWEKTSQEIKLKKGRYGGIFLNNIKTINTPVIKYKCKPILYNDTTNIEQKQQAILQNMITKPIVSQPITTKKYTFDPHPKGIKQLLLINNNQYEMEIKPKYLVTLIEKVFQLKENTNGNISFNEKKYQASIEQCELLDRFLLFLYKAKFIIGDAK